MRAPCKAPSIGVAGFLPSTVARLCICLRKPNHKDLRHLLRRATDIRSLFEPRRIKPLRGTCHAIVEGRHPATPIEGALQGGLIYDMIESAIHIAKCVCLWRLARRHRYLGALQGAQKELKKLATV